MKKLLTISCIAATLCGLTAYGQGYFTFTGPSRGAWDGSTGTAKNNTGDMIAFLWGSSSSTALLQGMSAGVGTNATPATSSYLTSAAWTAILNDPNFHLGMNAADSSLVTAATAANGSWGYSYLGAQSFGVQGTAINTTYNVVVIGWNTGGGQYLTPAAAAAAGEYVGWSPSFQYTSTDVPPIGVPGAMGVTKFGIAGAVPEPATFALAGLGAAAMLVFRRRK